MVLLNLGHRLTAEQIGEVEKIARQEIHRIIEVKFRVDPDRPVLPQIEELINGIENSGFFETQPYLVNLPGLSIAAAAVLAVLHGRSGYFPAVLSIRPVKDARPPEFEVVEIVNLQAVRDAARTRRPTSLRGR